MAEMTPMFLLEENKEPTVTEPIYLSSDESEYPTPNTMPDHHHESIYPDSFNRLIASQLEKRSNMSTETVFYPPTTNTSMISDDEEEANLTPILENLNNLPRVFGNGKTTQYNFANNSSLFQTRPNYHFQKIKIREIFSVLTIYPTHRHQHYVTTSPLSRQWLMSCEVWRCTPIWNEMSG